MALASFSEHSRHPAHQPTYGVRIDTRSLLSGELPPQNNNVLFLCYHGAQRSLNMAYEYVDDGLNAHFFSGGTQELQMQYRMGTHEQTLNHMAMFQYIMVLLRATDLGRDERMVLQQLTMKTSEQDHNIYFLNNFATFYRDLTRRKRA